MKGIVKRTEEFPREQFAQRLNEILAMGYRVEKCCSDLGRDDAYPVESDMAFITYIGAE